jgi:hypothetical protein
MAKRVWNDDETDETPNTTVTAVEVDEEEAAPAAASASSRKAAMTLEEKEAQLRAELLDYTTEYADIQHEDSTSAGARRNELRRLLRKTQKALDAMEPIVEVKVPRSPTGQFYHIGTQTFAQGTYKVRKSVAQMLLWAIQSQADAEVRMMKQNNRFIDLSAAGDRARNLEIMADN